MTVIPADPLRAVLSTEVVARLLSVPNPTKALQSRLDILTASGPEPLEQAAARRLAGLRAKKAAWDAYLQAAFACGLLEGTELRERLTGTNDDNFRSAMSECMVCWVLLGKLKLQVFPRPTGREGKVLDLGIPSQPTPRIRLGILSESLRPCSAILQEVLHERIRQRSYSITPTAVVRFDAPQFEIDNRPRTR